MYLNVGASPQEYLKFLNFPQMLVRFVGERKSLRNEFTSPVQKIETDRNKDRHAGH